MLRLLFVFLIASTSIRAWAEELAIIDIRRNITLSDDDPIYKDFYINTGDNSGLKKNLVVTAMRKISIRDASGSQAYGEILVPVGQLRIIAMYNRIAVAREYKLLSRDELPMLEQIGIMTGDHVDLQGAFVDNTKPKPKNKVSENKVSTTQVVSVATIVTATAVAPTVAPPAPIAESAVVDPTQAAKGPSPASIPTVPPTPTQENTPNLTSSTAPEPQKLEKTADSGNNSAL